MPGSQGVVCPCTFLWINLPLIALQQELFGNFKSSSYDDCSLSFLRKDLSDPSAQVPEWIM